MKFLNWPFLTILSTFLLINVHASMEIKRHNIIKIKSSEIEYNNAVNKEFIAWRNLQANTTAPAQTTRTPTTSPPTTTNPPSPPPSPEPTTEPPTTQPPTTEAPTEAPTTKPPTEPPTTEPPTTAPPTTKLPTPLPSPTLGKPKITIAPATPEKLVIDETTITTPHPEVHPTPEPTSLQQVVSESRTPSSGTPLVVLGIVTGLILTLIAVVFGINRLRIANDDRDDPLSPFQLSVDKRPTTISRGRAASNGARHVHNSRMKTHVSSNSSSRKARTNSSGGEKNNVRTVNYEYQQQYVYNGSSMTPERHDHPHIYNNSTMNSEYPEPSMSSEYPEHYINTEYHEHSPKQYFYNQSNSSDFQYESQDEYSNHLGDSEISQSNLWSSSVGSKNSFTSEPESWRTTNVPASGNSEEASSDISLSFTTHPVNRPSSNSNSRLSGEGLVFTATPPAPIDATNREQLHLNIDLSQEYPDLDDNSVRGSYEL